MVLFSVIASADGQYQILEDESGIYFQTETEGGWYIPEEDQSFFKAGQSGYYHIGRDENGRYLETEAGKFYIADHAENASAADSEGANPTPSPADAHAEATAVHIVGSHVIVPVQIKHRGRTLNLHLLLDTGASIVTLHKDAVRRLRMSDSRKAQFTTASGHMIPADIVLIDEVRFGPYRKEGIQAGIIEFQQGSGAGYDGLLGMNVLKGLRYDVDYDRSVIHWTQN